MGQAGDAKGLINDAISVATLAVILTAGDQSRKVRAFAFGAIAQLGERLHGMQEVGGSIPPSSTNRQVTACRSQVNRNGSPGPLHTVYLGIVLVGVGLTGGFLALFRDADSLAVNILVLVPVGFAALLTGTVISQLMIPPDKH
jgi:hypothetical protein